MRKKRKTTNRSEIPGPPDRGRLATGMHGMDDVLGGGLIRGRLYLVEGPPGAGKTVWVSQLCFHRARQGERVVYATLATESHGTLVESLRGFDFFDEELLAKQISFVSGLQPLREGGLEGLDRALRETLQTGDARLLVLDSLSAVLDRAPSLPELRHFIRDVATTCALLDCTAVCTIPDEAAGSPRTRAVENVADGIIEVSRLSTGLRTSRAIEIWKFRGSAHLDGKHLFEIDRTGIVVHARTEARLARPPVAQEVRRRAGFGIKALDRMLDGGVMEASTTAILGAPGSGKTILGLQFLAEGARRGEPSLYFGFFETPPRLIAKAEAVGIPLEAHVADGIVELLWQPALEFPIDALAGRLVDAVRRRGVRRLFIDSVDGFQAAALFPERLTRFFTALTNEVRALGATTLLSEELRLSVGTSVPPGAGSLSGCFENIFLLRYVEVGSQLHRLFSVVKMRESEYDTSVHEFRITNRGIDVATTFASAEQVLAGRRASLRRRR